MQIENEVQGAPRGINVCAALKCGQLRGRARPLLVGATCVRSSQWTDGGCITRRSSCRPTDLLALQLNKLWGTSLVLWVPEVERCTEPISKWFHAHAIPSWKGPKLLRQKYSVRKAKKPIFMFEIILEDKAIRFNSQSILRDDIYNIIEIIKSSRHNCLE